MKTLEEKLVVCNGCAKTALSMFLPIRYAKPTNSQPKFDDECADFKPAPFEVPEERTAYVAPPIINSQVSIRFANFLIDYVMVFILMFIAILFLAFSGFNVDAIGESQLYSYAVAIVVHFVYYTFAEGLTGRTIGKPYYRNQGSNGRWE